MAYLFVIIAEKVLAERLLRCGLHTEDITH